MPKEEIQAIRSAGVVGAGGAGFPTYKKLDAQVEFVIVNGAECEPLLRVDQQLIERYARYLCESLQKLVAITGAGRGIFALKAKYKGAVVALLKEVGDFSLLEIKLIDDFYPAGDEQVLLYEAIGRVVPEGGIPLDVGAVVTNVETLLNVGGALEGKPVIDKYVTITGAVEKPVTLKVALGTSIYDLVQLAHPLPDDYRIIEGGPMMGSLVDPAKPITKTTKGLIVLPSDHSLVVNKQFSLTTVLQRARAVCCQCNKCTAVCPRYQLGHRMEPHKVMRALGQGVEALAGDIVRAFLCCQCGACETFGCDMGLSPNKVNGELKKQLLAAGMKNPLLNKTPHPPEDRDFKKIPIKRLVARLGLENYNVPAPLAMDTFIPQRVELPLKQHIGAPAQAVVKEGDFIQRGVLIAQVGEEALGVPLHASISGRVVQITGHMIAIKN